MTTCAATVSRDLALPARDDVMTAAHIQRMMLPPSPLTANGWTAVHHIEPAASISGDFVDLVPFGDRLYFMLDRGDDDMRFATSRDVHGGGDSTRAGG